MLNAIATALGGLHSAAGRFNEAATRIVRAGTVSQSALQEPAPPPAAGAPLDRAPVLSDDLVTGIVDMKLAELSYKANAKVLAAAAELEKTTIDILG